MKTITALTDENAEGGSSRSYNPMELHPEDFKQTFAETWVEWMKEEKSRFDPDRFSAS
jgi:hypothetical protein